MADEIRRNGSGYYDPTAYIALKDYMKVERTMKKGEIWEIKKNNGTYVDAIVIADHGKVATILQITDFDDEGYIPVNCHGIKYTDPRMMQYAFANSFTEYIRTLTDAEMKEIMEYIGTMLGFESVHEKPEKVIEKIVEVPADADSELSKINADLCIEMTKVEAERDVYKKLYQDLISSVMKGA